MVVLLVSISTAAFAQKSGPRSGYNFTTIVDLTKRGNMLGLRNSLIPRNRITTQRQTGL